MSTFKVEVVQIKEVLKHPNADRLDIIQINGWQCVGLKDAYKVGDMVVYLPIDSILPHEVEQKLFPPDAKIKLHKSRLKSIKIRGVVSQGMLARFDVLGIPAQAEGTDVKELLGITKYEPPEESVPGMMRVKKVARKNPAFHEFGGLENFKNYNKIFEEGEPVVMTEKIHGTHFRAGWVPSIADTWWRKVLKLVGLLPKWEFAFGSNHVQLHLNLTKKERITNVYAKMVDKYDLQKRLSYGESIHGEIYGWKVQKNYNYGLPEGEQKLILFNLKVNGKFVSYDTFSGWCKTHGFDQVPLLYRGPFSLEKLKEVTKGRSVLCPEQKVREGAVVCSETETETYIGRKCLKSINDDYLLDDENTDFH